MNEAQHIRRINDLTTAATLAINRGAITNLHEWSGPAEPRDPTATDPNIDGDDQVADPTPAPDDGNPLDYQDPTGDAAGTRADIHAYALREINRILTNVQKEMEQVIDHLRMGLSTRQAEEIKAKLPPACKSCARLTDHQGRPLYSPVHARGLCDWCDNFERDWKQWPPVTILRAYHDGRRPNRRMIERALREGRVRT